MLKIEYDISILEFYIKLFLVQGASYIYKYRLAPCTNRKIFIIRYLCISKTTRIFEPKIKADTIPTREANSSFKKVSNSYPLKGSGMLRY